MRNFLGFSLLLLPFYFLLLLLNAAHYSMENNIEIEILYESKDFWRSYLASYFDFSSIFYSFFSFFAFGFFITLYFLGKQFELPDFVNVVLFSFQFTLLFGLVMSYFSVKNAQRYSAGKCEYIFSGEKVKIVAKSFCTETDWSWFYRARETGNYFFLYTRSNQTHLLPKRFFDAEQIDDFKNLLRSKFGDEAYLKKSREKLGLK
jgi:hypothetical protein